MGPCILMVGPDAITDCDCQFQPGCCCWSCLPLLLASSAHVAASQAAVTAIVVAHLQIAAATDVPAIAVAAVVAAAVSVVVATAGRDIQVRIVELILYDFSCFWLCQK